MREYICKGDILVPGEVIVVAENEDEAREKLDDVGNWIDYSFLDTRVRYLEFSHPESAEVREGELVIMPEEE